MANRVPSPDDSVLRQFLLGHLPPDELEAVARYLDGHPELASTLNTLKENDSLLAALRATPVSAAVESAEVAELIARVLAMPSAVGDQTATIPPPPKLDQAAVCSPAGATPDPEATRDPDPMTAGLLAPPEQPHELGRFGGYRVLWELGRGGMGVVFEAEELELGRRVALKVMAPVLAANPTARKRFVQEAKTTAALTHDHIIPIYRTGEHRGVPFLAMPLLIGETLDNRLKLRAPLAVPDVLVIGRQMAEGLSAAHAAGLIHRDIKPSNVWLERNPDGGFKRVRILDFGLAKGQASPGCESGGLTHAGAVLGTPAYMAPEQARGLVVDHRADLFSLGGVLYQMATGRRAFAGPDTFAILGALATETPPAPIEVNPAVPPALSELIARLLAKDPADRWPPTAQAVADELARIAGGQPAGSATQIAASPATPTPKRVAQDAWTGVAAAATEPEVAPKAARRKVGRGWWVLAGVLLLGLVAAGTSYGPTVIRIVLNEGELIVEVDDPTIEVIVKQGDAVIVDRTSKREFVLTAKNGQVEFVDPQTGATGLTKTFEMKRGDKVRVKATLSDIAAARPKPKGPDDPFKSLSGDALPPKDLFPGERVVWETFDDPKTCPLPLGEVLGGQATLKDGVYGYEEPAPRAGYTTIGVLGPAAPDVGFVTRVRAHRQAWYVTFRRQSGPDRSIWLRFRVEKDGNWELVRTRGARGARVGTSEWLSRSAAADPELAAGRWITLAVRSAGTLTEVWANGRLLTTHREADESGTGLSPDPEAVGFGTVRGSAMESAPTVPVARFEIDFVAVWKLPSASSGLAPLAAEWKALEWVLSVGGTLTLMAGGQERAVTPGGKLPDGPFTVRSVSLANVKGLDEADLNNLRNLPPVVSLSFFRTGDLLGDAGLAKLTTFPGLAGIEEVDLAGTAVTDAGLLHLKRFPRLQFLLLNGTRVTDAGVAHLSGLKLAILGLSYCPGIDGSGLVHLRAMTTLRSLNLSTSPVAPERLAVIKHLKLDALWLGGIPGTGDAAAEVVADMTTLRYLGLSKTGLTDKGVLRLQNLTGLLLLQLEFNPAVTGDAVKKLSEKLPSCRIEWDGEVIEPKGSPKAPASWALDRPPPKDAFPGEVVYEDTFDGPKPSNLPESAGGGKPIARFRDGVYSVEYPASEKRDRPDGLSHAFGPQAEAVAFVVRARATGLNWHFHFRPLEGLDRKTSLSLRIAANSQWKLERDHYEWKAGRWVFYSSTKLRPYADPVPDLVAGNWLTLAVRSQGPTTDVWVNGRHLATVSEPNPPAVGPEPGGLRPSKEAVRIAVGFLDSAACGCELDYLSIWQLPPEIPKK